MYQYQYPNGSAGLKLTIGRFLYDIRSRMPAALPLGLPPNRKLKVTKEGATMYPKMAIWSAHDDSLVPLLLALKSYSYWPVYASRLIFEVSYEKKKILPVFEFFLRRFIYVSIEDLECGWAVGSALDFQ